MFLVNAGAEYYRYGEPALGPATARPGRSSVATGFHVFTATVPQRVQGLSSPGCDDPSQSAGHAVRARAQHSRLQRLMPTPVAPLPFSLQAAT